MALANFFDRAATAASQVLRDFELDGFRARLEANPVEILFDEAIRAREGAYSMDMLVRLLARLYPKLVLTPIGAADTKDAIGYRELARSINPAIELEMGGIAPTLRLVIGGTPVEPVADALFYLGSDGWTALLSTANPVGSGSSDIPFGAGAAACFAAANCFRAVFRDQLVRGEPDHELSFSLADYGIGTAPPPAIAGLDMGMAHLVGAGAIGNAVLWTLGRLSGVSGILHVIDHETIDLGNLQRYVLPTQADIGRPKTAVARDALASSSFEVVPHPKKWHAFLARQEDWRFERVAVALDNAPDRLAVQAALPRWIANAWTQEQDLGVSRHHFGETTCLACLYLPRGKTKDQDELMAEELGMAENRPEIRRMLQTGEPIDAAFIGRVAAALQVEARPLLAFVGQPLIVFHQKAICGGIVLKLSNGERRVPTVVPLAFQSALAGLMLAAELVKNAAAFAPPASVATRINLLRPLARHVNDPKARDETGRCLCRDEDFLAAYTEKYAA